MSAAPRRRALVAAAVCLATIAGGCSPATDEPVPRGPSSTRYGERPLAVLDAVEESRARLVAASDLLAIGRRADALFHLARARAAYGALAAGTRAGDRVLAREIDAAFDAVAADIAARRPIEAVRARISPLSGQLLEGVADTLLSSAETADAGLRAELLLATTEGLSREYARAATAETVSPRDAARSRQHAYGLLARSQTIARGIADSLGPRAEAVTQSLSMLRERHFPVGIAPVPGRLDASAVAAAVAGVQDALRKRFALGTEP